MLGGGKGSFIQGKCRRLLDFEGGRENAFCGSLREKGKVGWAKRLGRSEKGDDSG